MQQLWNDQPQHPPCCAHQGVKRPVPSSGFVSSSTSEVALQRHIVACSRLIQHHGGSNGVQAIGVQSIGQLPLATSWCLEVSVQHMPAIVLCAGQDALPVSIMLMVD